MYMFGRRAGKTSTVRCVLPVANRQLSPRRESAELGAPVRNHDEPKPRCLGLNQDESPNLRNVEVVLKPPGKERRMRHHHEHRPEAQRCRDQSTSLPVVQLLAVVVPDRTSPAVDRDLHATPPSANGRTYTSARLDSSEV